MSAELGRGTAAAVNVAWLLCLAIFHILGAHIISCSMDNCFGFYRLRPAAMSILYNILLLFLILCLLGYGKKEKPTGGKSIAGKPAPAPKQKKGAEKPRRLLWVFRTGSDVFSSPAIGKEGIVYFGSEDRKVYAIDAETGEKKWEFKTGFDVGSSPAVGEDGTVYVGSLDNNVYALDGKTGAKIWEFQTGGGISSSPGIGQNGTIYIGSDDKKVYALDGKTGAKKWEFKTGNTVKSSPAIGADGTV